MRDLLLLLLLFIIITYCKRMHTPVNVIQHLERLQEFWSTLDDIDQSLWVVDPKQPSRATPYRQINIGDCFVNFCPQRWLLSS